MCMVIEEGGSNVKVKKGFILRKVGRQFVVAATGEESRNFHGMIRLNKEAAYAFDLLREDMTEEELIAALVEKYAADEAEVRADVAYFLGKLKEADALV